MIIIILSVNFGFVNTIYINSKLSLCEIDDVRIWGRVRLWVNIDVIRVHCKICVSKGEKICLSRLRSIILNEFEHIIDADENFRR